MSELKSLQERQLEKSKAKTDWDTPKKDWEYITIPTENALGETHASIGLNSYTFEPGKTYQVPPAIAATVRERLATYARACIRVLQPRRDIVSESQVAIGTTGPNRGSATPVDPSTLG